MAAAACNHNVGNAVPRCLKHNPTWRPRVQQVLNKFRDSLLPKIYLGRFNTLLCTCEQGYVAQRPDIVNAWDEVTDAGLAKAVKSIDNFIAQNIGNAHVPILKKMMEWLRKDKEINEESSSDPQPVARSSALKFVYLLHKVIEKDFAIMEPRKPKAPVQQAKKKVKRELFLTVVLDDYKPELFGQLVGMSGRNIMTFMKEHRCHVRFENVQVDGHEKVKATIKKTTNDMDVLEKIAEHLKTFATDTQETVESYSSELEEDSPEDHAIYDEVDEMNDAEVNEEYKELIEAASPMSSTAHFRDITEYFSENPNTRYSALTLRLTIGKQITAFHDVKKKLEADAAASNLPSMQISSLSIGRSVNTALITGASSSTPSSTAQASQSGASSGRNSQSGVVSGGTNQSGLSPGGTNQSGVSSGGTNQLGVSSGGTNQLGVISGGTNQSGVSSGGTNQSGVSSGSTNQSGASTSTGATSKMTDTLTLVNTIDPTGPGEADPCPTKCLVHDRRWVSTYQYTLTQSYMHIRLPKKFGRPFSKLICTCGKPRPEARLYFVVEDYMVKAFEKCKEKMERWPQECRTIMKPLIAQLEKYDKSEVWHSLFKFVFYFNSVDANLMDIFDADYKLPGQDRSYVPRQEKSYFYQASLPETIVRQGAANYSMSSLSGASFTSSLGSFGSSNRNRPEPENQPKRTRATLKRLSPADWSDDCYYHGKKKKFAFQCVVNYLHKNAGLPVKYNIPYSMAVCVCNEKVDFNDYYKTEGECRIDCMTMKTKLGWWRGDSKASIQPYITLLGDYIDNKAITDGFLKMVYHFNQVYRRDMTFYEEMHCLVKKQRNAKKT